MSGNGNASVTVMVAPGWLGQFSRVTKRSASGEVQAKIVFQRDTPYALSGDDLHAVRADIGRALVIVKFDEKNRPRPDRDATHQFAAAVHRETELSAKKNEMRRKKAPAPASSTDLAGVT